MRRACGFGFRPGRMHGVEVCPQPLDRSRCLGFTILEVLVAAAVLALVLVMMLQVTEGILRSTRAQNQQMDSVAAARRALDVLVNDLKSAVSGNSAAILARTAPSDDILALLTQRRGPQGAAGHRFLAVQYSTNSAGQLLRSYRSATFAETNLLQSAALPPTPPLQPLAEGILAFRVFARTQDGSTNLLSSSGGSGWAATGSYNGLPVPSGWQALITPAATWSASGNRATALEIWLAALDPQNFSLLQSSGTLGNAQAALAGTPDTWRNTFDGASLPSPAKSALRILHRTVPLP